jgi:hypothetical protein
MSDCTQAFESLADDAVAVAPETGHGEMPVSPELRALMEELDKHLQSFLREHNSAERFS